MKKTRLVINSIAHLVVDMACFYVLYAYIANSEAASSNMQIVAVAFLTYDFIAFGLQYILGFIYDKLPKIRLACIGIALVFVGVLLKNIPMAAMIAVSLGNAAFHVGGGADTLKESNGFCESGVFVSFGALGVYFGTLLGKSEIGFVAILCALAACGIGELITSRHPVREKEVKCAFEKKSKHCCRNSRSFGGDNGPRCFGRYASKTERKRRYCRNCGSVRVLGEIIRRLYRRRPFAEDNRPVSAFVGVPFRSVR